MDDDYEPAEFGLVMPFVVTTEDGGPYDSASFLAGWTGAAIAAQLETLASVKNATALRCEQYVHPALVPQLDLVAMNCGFTLTTTPWDEHPDEWTLAVFTKETTDG